MLNDDVAIILLNCLYLPKFYQLLLSYEKISLIINNNQSSYEQLVNVKDLL